MRKACVLCDKVTSGRRKDGRREGDGEGEGKGEGSRWEAGSRQPQRATEGEGLVADPGRAAPRPQRGPPARRRSSPPLVWLAPLKRVKFLQPSLFLFFFSKKGSKSTPKQISKTRWRCGDPHSQDRGRRVGRLKPSRAERPATPHLSPLRLHGCISQAQMGRGFSFFLSAASRSRA